MSTPPNGPYGGPPGQPGQFPPGQPGQLPPGQPGGQFQPGYNPYVQATAGQGYAYAPPGRIADFGVRAGSALIDSLLQSIPLGIGLIATIALSSNSPQSAAGGVAIVLGFLGSLAVWFWNRVIIQGRSGKSIGKKITGLRIVHAQTGEQLGFGANLGREVMAYVFNYICFLNLLWPLWDAKVQTWHDKIVNDIVIRD
ncbi:RDD family protein [Kribbella sandramycini]|uniref:Putative RDD family membrane protein YckC n=1 Tax=Kribbella sandramycini TaxID=60450 RepID=A0A7Y4L271_9ACTN|nr:putative RDD family membrane protein YckC [Kribbella sandramycini]NOL42938.1 RDD family protein [Kribbella sandramycini]